MSCQVGNHREIQQDVGIGRRILDVVSDDEFIILNAQGNLVIGPGDTTPQ